MCLFCRISEGDAPCYKVYEDSNVLALLDIHPTSKGHTIVITKHHADDVLDCNEEVYSHLMLVVKRLANHIMKTFDAEGINILTNCKEAAGQTIQHFHVHIIPRYDANDGYRAIFEEQDNMDFLQIQHDCKMEPIL